MDLTVAKKSSPRALWHPKFWPAWCGVFVLYLLSFLPLGAKQHVGAWLGRLTFRVWGGRRKVALRNLEVCFPHLAPTERRALAEENFVACLRGALETLHAWWRDMKPGYEKSVVLGLEHLRAAQAEGKGILLIGAHYSIFDFALPLIAHYLKKPGYMYRPNDNPVIDGMIERGRRRHGITGAFTKRQTRQMLNFLRDGGEVWYACDQDFGKYCDLFVPFCGVPAGVISAPSGIARESGAKVICVSHLRLPDGRYEIAFSPVLEGFGVDKQADAEAWCGFHEAAVKRHPDQYLWLHKRFKTRPAGAPPIY